MANIQLYKNETFSTRAVQDENGTIWFVAQDIAEAIEYPENSIRQMDNLCASVPEIWKGHKQIMTLGGEQEMLCLTEQGVYFFLGRSSKPKALPYQMWFARDVVPSIRKNSSYSIDKKQLASLLGELDGTELIFKTIEMKNNQLTLVIDEDHQFTLAFDEVYKSYTSRSALQSDEADLITPKKKQLLTPNEIGQFLGISGCRVNELLAYAGYQHKISDFWEPIGEGERYAVMLSVSKKHSSGTPVRQLKWSSKILPILERMLQEANHE